jgi:hypothetical protein
MPHFPTAEKFAEVMDSRVKMRTGVRLGEAVGYEIIIENIGWGIGDRTFSGQIWEENLASDRSLGPISCIPEIHKSGKDTPEDCGRNNASQVEIAAPFEKTFEPGTAYESVLGFTGLDTRVGKGGERELWKGHRKGLEERVAGHGTRKPEFWDDAVQKVNSNGSPRHTVCREKPFNSRRVRRTPVTEHMQTQFQIGNFRLVIANPPIFVATFADIRHCCPCASSVQRTFAIIYDSVVSK